MSTSMRTITPISQEVTRLTDALQLAGLTRYQVASALGVTERSLSRWRSGVTTPATSHIHNLRLLVASEAQKAQGDST